MFPELKNSSTKLDSKDLPKGKEMNEAMKKALEEYKKKKHNKN